MYKNKLFNIIKVCYVLFYYVLCYSVLYCSVKYLAFNQSNAQFWVPLPNVFCLACWHELSSFIRHFFNLKLNNYSALWSLDYILFKWVLCVFSINNTTIVVLHIVLGHYERESLGLTSSRVWEK
jgi:hypothetical protein